ncbi:MAG: ParB/Srx family N-terminal domain-containing protein [Cyanobacteriota bacterium]|nr:ParB/Srx family N-terminal domain-containing protein [Cyanobacteriota bacterium]
MKTSKNDVLELELSEIKAGQPAIGQDQVLYKVGRYDGVNWILEAGYPVQGRTFSDNEKMFDDVAYANGQKVDNAVIVRFDDSTPGNPDSYYVYNENWERVAPGTVTNGMKTVVIGPDKNPYLTDGHHTLNTFSQMKRGGFEDFKINLVVEANYSNLKDKNNNGSSMDEFWIEMANSGNAWLKVLNENEPG